MTLLYDLLDNSRVHLGDRGLLHHRVLLHLLVGEVVVVSEHDDRLHDLGRDMAGLGDYIFLNNVHVLTRWDIGLGLVVIVGESTLGLLLFLGTLVLSECRPPFGSWLGLTSTTFQCPGCLHMRGRVTVLI